MDSWTQTKKHNDSGSDNLCSCYSNQYPGYKTRYIFCNRYAKIFWTCLMKALLFEYLSVRPSICVRLLLICTSAWLSCPSVCFIILSFCLLLLHISIVGWLKLFKSLAVLYFVSCLFYSPAAICRPAETGGIKNVKPAIETTTRARHRKMRAALPTAKIQYYNNNQRS